MVINALARNRERLLINAKIFSRGEKLLKAARLIPGPVGDYSSALKRILLIRGDRGEGESHRDE